MILLWTWIDPTMASLHRVALFVVGAGLGGCALVAFGEFIRPAAKPEAEQSSQKQTRDPRTPTLEASSGGKIDATGAVIPGDLPFQFGKVEGGGVIDMPGIRVTRKEDGTITVTPGATPVNRTFPPPTGEFSRLSDVDLEGELRKTARELRAFQTRLEAEQRALPQHLARDDLEKAASTLWAKYKAEYDVRLLPSAYSLACEALHRLRHKAPGDTLHFSAGSLLYHKSFAGPRAALDAAEFLEQLAQLR
jgi:hypothetical protein